MQQIPTHVRIDIASILKEFSKQMRAASIDYDIDPILCELWSALWKEELWGQRLDDSIIEVTNSFSDDGYTEQRMSQLYDAISYLAYSLRDKATELGMYLNGIIPYDFYDLQYGLLTVKREDV